MEGGAWWGLVWIRVQLSPGRRGGGVEVRGQDRGQGQGYGQSVEGWNSKGPSA